MIRVKSGMVRGLALTVLAVVAAQAATPAHAQAQGSLSDETVRKLMSYAWQQTPARFTKPENVVVTIDKTKPDAVMIPVENAREIIVAARRSALAQICKLDEHQLANYRSLMLREVQKKKWNPQQEVYINMLHLTTVQIFAGEVTIKVKDDGDKVIEETPIPNKRAQSCTDAESAKLKEQIEAYVNSGPGAEVLPAVAGQGQAAPAQATPAKAAPTTTGSTSTGKSDKK